MWPRMVDEVHRLAASGHRVQRERALVDPAGAQIDQHHAVHRNSGTDDCCRCYEFCPVVVAASGRRRLPGGRGDSCLVRHRMVVMERKPLSATYGSIPL